MIAGLALFMFGSGPIKGFAVVLVLGILTSVYSAIFVSRGIRKLYLWK
jgi:preprotein translocase subunit SecD